MSQRPSSRTSVIHSTARTISKNAQSTTPSGICPENRRRFLEQWKRDVFPTLVPRKRWTVEKRNARVDDIVIMQDTNTIRGLWTVGRIINVYPGEDGKVRNVRVKTAT